MSDLISRQAVLDKFQALCDVCGEGEKYNGVMCRACALDDGICIVEDIPSAEPLEDFEWCHDCKEYDQEKHCCHRWTKVIRKTVEEVKSNQWIPVTEALPEEMTMVLVTCADGTMRTSVLTDITYWHGIGRGGVIAWMPLPEPWRGEE